MVQQPKTTWGGVLIGVGTVVLAVGNYLSGHPVDWATIAQTLLGLLSSGLLIKARDWLPK